MAITSAMCSSFKVESWRGLHNFDVAGDQFKIALYTSAATLDASTTVYSATNEVVGAGYTAGGKDLTNVQPVLDGTTAVGDFADTSWTTATITAAGALIYNSTNGDRAVAVISFGGDQSSTAGTFTVVFPVAAAATAIIRFA